MATVIRFARHGTKKKPYFRIVVQDHHSPRDGKFIEHIGAYDPQKGDASLVISRDRLGYWMGVGAKLSDSVRTRLKTQLKDLQVPIIDKEAQPKAPAKEA